MKKVCLVIMVILIFFIFVSCNQTQSIEINLSHPIDVVNGYKNIDIERFEFLKKEWQEKELSYESIKNGRLDGNEWDVYLENNKIVIFTEINYERFKFDIDDGYFLSENFGEFGGKIDFINNGGEIYTVLNCNPNYMFSINNDVYLLEGLSHFGIRGNIYKLSKTNGKWEDEKKVNLNGNPLVYTIDKGDIYIIIDAIYYEYNGDNIVSGIVYSKLIKIPILEDNIEIQEILEASDVLTFANSMVKKDNLLYIGLSGGLATIDLNSNKIRFYVKKT